MRGAMPLLHSKSFVASEAARQPFNSSSNPSMKFHKDVDAVGDSVQNIISALTYLKWLQFLPKNLSLLRAVHHF